MLELLALYYLSKKNKANALARGRQPGFFVAITVILWVGMELLGVVLGAYVGGQIGAYLLALVFAAAGGAISYVLAKNCKPGAYAPLSENLVQAVEQYAQPLTAAAGIRIVYERSFAGSDVTFVLNGRRLGSLAQGSSVDTYTNQRQNILRAADSDGNETAPFLFDVADNGDAEIFFKANRFVAERSTGIYPPTMPQPPYAESAKNEVCRQCDAILADASVFCPKCGTKL
jgi:hypothetical protein